MRFPRYIFPGFLPILINDRETIPDDCRKIRGKTELAGKILLLNGPNLNLLGEREPERYGHTTLAEIEAGLSARAAAAGAVFQAFQSNHEGELVDFVQRSCRPGDGVIVNAGAYTHTSIALRDALVARQVRLVEVHLSNIHAREPFRRRSYLSAIAIGVIVGLGAAGYRYALDYLLAEGTASSGQPVPISSAMEEKQP
jgi:3-dehydroquinate dehydratase-2